MAKDLVKALSDLKEQEVVKIVEERLRAKEDPLKILEDARKGMEIVGKRFASSEYFIPDLVYSGEILKSVTELVKPNLTKAAEGKKLGKIVFGTVAGDIHDIGKDIVVFMLDVNGFEVHDLGVDVPAQKFVEKIKETGAPIVGLSGFLTLAFDSMKQTLEAIKAAGLRDKVKVMIGGGQITEEVTKYTGADAYGKDAVAGVSLAKKWAGVK
ncbi:MAG: cobalamin-dependent protein [Dehalococcoidia bacterium]|nr:cobalamin-dependent protein [Dehalococcoidia bacterium]MDH4368036.1 cobalamin-dependent protein [Dehalococcoidia bacterium]